MGCGMNKLIAFIMKPIIKHVSREVRAAVLAERERCAQICEEEGVRWQKVAPWMHSWDFKLCAAAIRADRWEEWES